MGLNRKNTQRRFRKNQVPKIVNGEFEWKKKKKKKALSVIWTV